MLYYAPIFMVVGLIVGAIALLGIVAEAGLFAWILYLIGFTLLVIHVIHTFNAETPRSL
jgi:uncharacterized membrane protein YtjA (UPF0391 family)